MEIIVDLFNQHSGNMAELKRLVLSAFLNGADVAKLQLLNSRRIWGDDSRSYLEMSFEQVREIYDYCQTVGIEFMATAFDEEKLEWLDELGVSRYKIASVTARKEPELCQKILKKNKETIISLGQYPDGEFPFGHNTNIKYLYCIAQYPTYLYDEKVGRIPGRFSSRGYTGYSDHVVGIATALKAFLGGAKILEKHFTFDHYRQGECEKAHACSFTPETLRQFKNLISEFSLMPAGSSAALKDCV